MDRLWRVAVCVYSHTPLLGGAQRRNVCDVLSLIGTMQSYPNYPPSCSCDWPYYLQSTNITDRIVITETSAQINSVTLKMETALSSESLIHLTTAQCRNTEEGHRLINNRCEVLKTYNNVQAGFLYSFAIELK